jgi:hypothetical protein
MRAVLQTFTRVDCERVKNKKSSCDLRPDPCAVPHVSILETWGILRFYPVFFYHTRQLLSGIIGWPLWQPKALPNSSKFCTTPFTRNIPGECGSTFADTRCA